MNLLKFSILMLMSLALFGCMSKQTKLRLSSAFGSPPLWYPTVEKTTEDFYLLKRAVEQKDKDPVTILSQIMDHAESYELKKFGGIYRMKYQSRNLPAKYYPVTISGTPFVQETDAEGVPIENPIHYKHGFKTTFDKWTITLVDQNIEPISTLRPNGDHWNINDDGSLEVWESGTVVDTIPNPWGKFFIDFSILSLFAMDENTKTHGGKCYWINDQGEVKQLQQMVDDIYSFHGGLQKLFGNDTEFSMDAAHFMGFRPVIECAEGHQWEESQSKNGWCPTCFDPAAKTPLMIETERILEEWNK